MKRVAAQSFLEFGNARLRALCQAVGFEDADTQTVQRFFTFMGSPWGEQRIGTIPIWRSDITDDHTPFEFSLALEGTRPEIRFLIEAQGTRANPTTLQSSWHDGLLLNHRLHREFGVPLERFACVQDLFEPRNPSVRFSLWHAFCLKPGGEPEFKVYLNPHARGPEQAKALVKEALERLGFSRAWRCLSEVAMRRGEKDQPVYFSLDLSAHRAARVKLYVAHREATCEDIQVVMSQAKEHAPDEVHAFCKGVLRSEGPFLGTRSTLTCLSFTSDEDARPSSVTLHCPIRSYAKHDQDAMERIGAILAPKSHAVLERAVRALANRRLDEGVGLIQWASMRWQGSKARTTFYLATEAYGTPRVLPRVLNEGRAREDGGPFTAAVA